MLQIDTLHHDSTRGFRISDFFLSESLEKGTPFSTFRTCRNPAIL